MEKAGSITNGERVKIVSLGREVKVSPKSLAWVNKAGYKKEFFVETVTVTIGIGNDHVAELVMDLDAWNALNAGKNIHVTTKKEFIENIKMGFHYVG